MYWEDEKKSCSEGNIIGNGGVTKRPMAEDGQTDKCDDEVSLEGGCSNGGVTKRPRAEEGHTENVLPEGGSTMPRRGRGRPLGSKKRRRGRPQGSKNKPKNVAVHGLDVVQADAAGVVEDNRVSKQQGTYNANNRPSTQNIVMSRKSRRKGIPHRSPLL